MKVETIRIMAIEAILDEVDEEQFSPQWYTQVETIFDRYFSMARENGIPVSEFMEDLLNYYETHVHYQTALYYEFALAQVAKWYFHRGNLDQKDRDKLLDILVDLLY